MFTFEVGSDLEREYYYATITNTFNKCTYRVDYGIYSQLIYTGGFANVLTHILGLPDEDAEVIEKMLNTWSEYIINNKRENIYD